MRVLGPSICRKRIVPVENTAQTSSCNSGCGGSDGRTRRTPKQGRRTGAQWGKAVGLFPLLAGKGLEIGAIQFLN